MKQRLTPQEKKRNRYDRDHVTLGWSTGTKFRKNWREKEALAERAHRRAWRAATRAMLGPEDPDGKAANPRRRHLRKQPPPTVRELVAHRTERRRKSHGAKAARRAKQIDYYALLIERALGELLRQAKVADLARLRNLTSYVCAELAFAPRRAVVAFLEAQPAWRGRIQQWRQALWADFTRAAARSRKNRVARASTRGVRAPM